MPPPAGSVGLRFVNACPCPVHISSPIFNESIVVSHVSKHLVVRQKYHQNMTQIFRISQYTVVRGNCV